MTNIDVWGEDPPLPPINQQPWEYVAAEMRTWAEDEEGHYQQVLLMGAEMLEQMGADQYGKR
jgi:hypothetical protein